MEEKKYETKDRNRLLISFLKGSLHYFVISVICIILVTLLDLVTPRVISFTVDSVIGDKVTDISRSVTRFLAPFLGTEASNVPQVMRADLRLVALLVIIIALFSVTFRYLFNVFNSKGAEKLVKTIRDSLYRHIEMLPLSWHTENKTGDIIQRCTSDVETVKQFVAEQLTSLFKIILLIVLSITFMANINPMLTVFASLFFPVLILISLLFRKKFDVMFKEVDEEEGLLQAITQENLTGVRVVRAFGREEYERDRFEKQNMKFKSCWDNLNVLMASFWTVGDLLAILQGLTVVAIGSYLGVKGELTAGEFIAFNTYNNMIIWPVRQLGRVISQLSRANIALDRINYIMSAEPEKDIENAAKPDMNKDIVFDHVTFSYPGSSEKVLDDVSFTIKAGSTVGILGSTGSGKSTLMFLLLRLYELPDGNGSITIGGVDIRDIDRFYLRENVGLVLQEPYLFSKTIGENIGIGVENATDDRIRKAAETSSLLDTIKEFKKGFNTAVGERGVTLSGGQKQRTAIAQIVIRNTPVQIFDDSLSAVDTETDAKIRDALSKESADTTRLIIAHRLTTLMSADNIIVFENGKVCEEGTHRELLDKGGIYKKIFDIQTEGRED
ncbi:MAG: ABC transporter ATP-binding protein [Catonella sp.]|nr:ABC transporter ATP-binding protein [Catonella sp.]MDY6357150.1 ABC transporter ATP-binding protein [Catonella sp.]